MLKGLTLTLTTSIQRSLHVHLRLVDGVSLPVWVRGTISWNRSVVPGLFGLNQMRRLFTQVFCVTTHWLKSERYRSVPAAVRAQHRQQAGGRISYTCMYVNLKLRDDVKFSIHLIGVSPHTRLGGGFPLVNFTIASFHGCYLVL